MKTKCWLAVIAITIVVFSATRGRVVAAPSTPAAVQGGLTERVSVTSSGVQGIYDSTRPAISADGRFVAFMSMATNLVVPDTNGTWDIFVRDRQSGTTERVSVATDGTQGNNVSRYPAISADGRYVTFMSYATNLVSGDTNGRADVFLRDRQAGVTERISIATSGQQGDYDSGYVGPASLSADGRYVVFESFATTLVAHDTNDGEDIFVRDRQNGTTERVSVAVGGAQANSASDYPSISADGRYVAFSSTSSNLIATDTNGAEDVFVYDRLSGANELISLASDGSQGNSSSWNPSISADGSVVTFASLATNLVSGDVNGYNDVFVRDRLGGTTELISQSTGGAWANRGSLEGPSISADGRFVAYWSESENLVTADANGRWDIFLRDRQAGTTERISLATNGTEGNDNSREPVLSADGRFVAFGSYASNLVAGDTNMASDIFVRDRGAKLMALYFPAIMKH